jgi:hypothetical protein
MVLEEAEGWWESLGGWESAVVDCVCSLLRRLEFVGMGVISLDEEGRWSVSTLPGREVAGR